MLKKIILILFLLTIMTVALFGQEIQKIYLRFSDNLPQVKQTIENKVQKEIQKEVNIAIPLRAKEESPQSFLTIEGVIASTNRERIANGLAPLSQNSILNESALNKTSDMFEKQYFAHDSPDGLAVSDLADNVGYEYITIGENLALGNFLDDDALVKAWMESPGHRANILNNRYTEIGVGVLRNTYQDSSTWMAVQHFGLPLSACPKIDHVLLETIKNNQSRLSILQDQLSLKKEELQGSEPKNSQEYKQKIEEYNSLVNNYNSLLEQTKSSADQYNTQVSSFNQCAS